MTENEAFTSSFLPSLTFGAGSSKHYHSPGVRFTRARVRDWVLRRSAQWRSVQSSIRVAKRIPVLTSGEATQALREALKLIMGELIPKHGCPKHERTEAEPKGSDTENSRQHSIQNPLTWSICRVTVTWLHMVSLNR